MTEKKSDQESFSYAKFAELVERYPKDQLIGGVAVARVLLDLLDDSTGGDDLDSLFGMHEIISRKIDERYQEAVRYIRDRTTIGDFRERYLDFLIDKRRLDEAAAEAKSTLVVAITILRAIEALRAEGIPIYVTNFYKPDFEDTLFERIFKSQ